MDARQDAEIIDIPHHERNCLLNSICAVNNNLLLGTYTDIMSGKSMVCVGCHQNLQDSSYLA